jgi:hypothetical protein
VTRAGADLSQIKQDAAADAEMPKTEAKGLAP